MKLTIVLTLALSSVLIGSNAGAAGKAVNDSMERRPVLLELFTSEGCSSCPSADRLLQSLDKTQPIAGADLIVLSEHVDYWNRSGWSDPFSSPAFSARQRDYADKLGLDSVYTPQLIVDGTAELVGSNAVEARNEITKAMRKNKMPIALTNTVRHANQVSVHVELAPLENAKGKATVFLALADNEDHSQVARGENAGRFLSHVAVVRMLISIGTVGKAGFAKDVTIPLTTASSSGLRVVAFVQDQASRRVLGVVQQKI